jgi:hypothetical protein
MRANDRALAMMTTLGLPLMIACGGDGSMVGTVPPGMGDAEQRGAGAEGALGNAGLELSLVDTSCNDVLDTLLAAEDLALNALDVIANEAALVIGGAGRRALEQRFGPVSQADVEFIFDTYALVTQNLVATTYQCRDEIDPDCSGDFSGAFARTSFEVPTVRLCPAYFDAVIGANTKASVLIHEATHHNRNSPSGAGTDDDSFPSVFNASSFELYALNCIDGSCLD